MIERNKLPGDPTALILSIASAAVILAGCCCGLLFPISLTLGIIGLVQAQKNLRIYEATPENYSPRSKENMVAAKIIGIIGICLSAIATIVFTVYCIFVGSLISTKLWDEMRRKPYNDDNIDRIALDSLLRDERVKVDSTATDTTFIYNDSITE